MDNPDEEKLPSAPSPSSGDLPDGLVLVSSGSEAQDAEDEDHEEGEIQDEDEDEQEQQQQQQQELEDISSEEESTIRERMAALEAMDKKLGMMKKKIANRSIYEGYLDEEDVMNGKENYCYYYPQHQQSSYRTQKAYKSSAPAGREDSRHGTSKREKRTSGTKRHAEKPPKEKPVKRSSHRHRKRRKYASRSTSPAQRRPVSTDSEPETTAVDREYLKIACGIGNSKSGRLPGGRNPLKKKLLLQAAQKRKSATAGKRTPVAIVSLDSSSSEHDMELDDDEGDGEEEEEEEEEELKLRLLALSTKPVVREAGLSDIISELQIPSPPPPPAIQLQTDPTADDQSAEELRLIALKTAILKKHATRCKRRELDNEQPYSPSDDIVLSPVREMPPPYDPSGVYSDGRDSVELLDDDTDDVQIVEPQYEHIDLVDSDDNGNDMEISPLASPLGGTDRAEQDMEEDSQQPIDMELASSSENSRSGRPSPIGDGRRSGLDQKLLLLHTTAADTCDSALFHRRGDLVPESPPVTPDSMEEAEAEALRHLLLTKMRQKQSKRQEQEVVVRDEMALPTVRDEALETVPTEASFHEVPLQREPEVEEEEEEEIHSAPKTQQDPARPNLITLVDQKQPVRKRRKKSLAIASATDVPAAPVTPVSPSPTLPEPPPKPAKAAPALVQTQKLVNNPNKLINLNRSAAPSPPMRTESPKELTTVDTFVSRPVPKLVIQLGHSDSDSDVDFGGATTESGGAVNGTAMPPTARFEEQLDKFLKSVRSKSTAAGTNEAAEGGEEELPHSERAGANSGKSLHSIRQQQATKQAAKKQPTSSSTMATPTAVKHLSKSAQLEYMKLVARMAQLERDKLARQQTQATVRLTSDNGSSSTSDAVPRDNSVPKVVVAASAEPVSSKSAAEQRTEPKSGKSPGRRKQAHTGSTPTKVADTQEPVLDPIERKLQQIRASLPNLTEASRNRLLLTAETQLETHSDSFLSDLEQHNATIIEAQQARRELYHLESRIDLLREKLALLEKVHERQRVRTRDTLANLHTTRKKILSGRKRSGELERMCIQIGRAVKGESYHIRKPTLEEFKEEMIANHKRRLANAHEMNAYDNEQSEERQQVVPEEEQEEEEEDDEEETKEQQEEEVQSPPVDGAVVVDAEQKCASEVREQTEELCEADPQTVPNEEIEQEDAEDVQTPSEQLEQLDMQSIEAAKEAESDSKPLEQLSVQTDAPAAADKDDQVTVLENSATVQAEPQSDVQMRLEEETVPDQCQMDDTANETEELVVGEAYRIEKYTSPLMSLKQSAQNIPTDGILCPYELGGQCVDRDCKYEHFNQRAA
uniref:Zf-C3H1 domain-containing protein n=1 Tax=Anopheles quadriannulatus TaxID=34691 RepID=A0A182WX97_ANOQN